MATGDIPPGWSGWLGTSHRFGLMSGGAVRWLDQGPMSTWSAPVPAADLVAGAVAARLVDLLRDPQVAIGATLRAALFGTPCALTANLHAAALKITRETVQDLVQEELNRQRGSAPQDPADPNVPLPAGQPAQHAPAPETPEERRAATLGRALARTIRGDGLPRSE